ncbi:MAG: polysaccharide deacetylase family protein [Sphingomonadaceae bacterium]|uniref:polysaccharide deacetylase family protein n=1 Tax=Thermaurantiacus sp. TaxID=2820283 RepID=UPI00298F0FA4|nr:polysaccharide deacetylase family protein [Thermaurantiacus sp.]MCS6987260.1 polysaccharide deacetylase family protein [Sphingomonadaceae bacterium]MDW8414480.1 polysaccharide deacetylase family protein [Thermaurantiacus sp.]
MTLDPAYLAYPRRRYGYDHDLYSWQPWPHRPPLAWPHGARVVVLPVVVSEFFPLTPSDRPFRAPGHMATPFPDYRHYTARDYGNRIGIFRLLDALEARGLKGAVAMNVAVAERYPALLEAVRAGGHEIVAHGRTMNDVIDSSLSEAEERSIVTDTRARWAALGEAPSGWLSIARSQSWRTPQILKDAGFTFTLDWPNDDRPWRFANGLINVPLHHELADRQVIGQLGALAADWARQVAEAVAVLAGEGGRMLGLELVPYVSGLPYRIAAVERLLDTLLARNDVWFATPSALLAAWAEREP